MFSLFIVISKNKLIGNVPWIFFVLVIPPGEVISEEYSLEYGTDKMEMHVGAVQAGDRALVVDDLIATGGTLCAAMKLLGSVLCWYVDFSCH